VSEVSEEFAWLYHEHHSRHEEDLHFWREQLERQGGPFLELGCGTGRVLLRLADENRHAFGLDKSKSMLKVLRENIPATVRDCVHIIQADLTAFRLSRDFPLVILPCNTYSTLSPANRKAALIRIQEHLAHAGRFAASLPNPDLLKSLPEQGDVEVEEDFPHPVDRRPVQVSSSWKRTSDQFTLHYDYDHLFEDGRVVRASIETSHYLTPPKVLLDELTTAGLSIERIYGDYDRSPYNDSSPGLIITASNH